MSGRLASGNAVDPRPGEIVDYISGVHIRATPEEVDAVQVFSHRLVEDFGYSKTQIRTRPQFRVRRSPSDEGGSYPVDIAVFHGDEQTERNLYMIVECKRASHTTGVAQLQRYLEMSPAQIGVWFNGDDHAYLQKVVHANGAVTFQELPTIPRRGQRLQDIGRFRRRDLVRPVNLRAVFRALRNNLAPNLKGITRDPTIAQEIINLLFCKLYDEVETGLDEYVQFRCGVDEPVDDVKGRIVDIFEKVKAQFSDVFSEKEVIEFDARSVAHVVGELQNYCIMDAHRDAIGDAFEVFIGPAIAGNEGQFFTPRNVVRMVISMIDPKPGEMVIDPACGSGGFLIMALDHVWNQVAAKGKAKGWSPVTIDQKRREVASQCFRGIDKDGFLAKVTKAYMAIIGDGRGGVFCESSLEPESEWRADARAKIGLGKFDVVVTNPPFGQKMRISDAPLLSQYRLARKWKKRKKGGEFDESEAMHGDRPPQLLFIERCLQMLNDKGRLGIVIPESIIGNPSYEHVIHFLREHATIKAIVTLPESLFKTSGKGGTHTKTCVVIAHKGASRGPHDIFMADVKWCGHDSRGNPTFRPDPETGQLVLLDEVPEVAQRYADIMSGREYVPDHRGYLLSSSELTRNILVPRFYNPEIVAYLESLRPTHDLIMLGDLVKSGSVEVITGVEVGKMAYGTGTIPFIRTSDLVNWEIKSDFKHGVSAEIYEQYRSSSDVAAGDVLMVRDGTYLIGTTAIVSDSDLPMLIQSHVLRFRVLDPARISPWLLFACLNAPVVQQQIRSKQFTQDIIDTLGARWKDLMLPVPKDAALRSRIVSETQYNVETRAALRNRTAEISREVEWPDSHGPLSASSVDEDERDREIARQRLAEIAEHPERLVRGTELEERLRRWEQEA
ncbi:MAG: N-6 DNA methylase [Vicinamibacterales bacterium]